MNFNKFGKFIFPTVATLCTLDVLSSVYDDMSYYDHSCFMVNMIRYVRN